MNGGDSMFFDCMGIVKLVSELLVAGVVKYVIEYPHKERQILEDYDHLIKKLKLMSTEVRIMGFHNEEIHMPQNKLNDIEMDTLKRLEPKINNNYLNVMMLLMDINSNFQILNVHLIQLEDMLGHLTKLILFNCLQAKQLKMHLDKF